MKNILPIAVILLVVLFGGYYVWKIQKSKSTAMAPSVASTSQPQSNVFTSIKDALSKSLSLKCVYPSPDGKGNITSYIKNGAVRVMSLMMGPEGAGSVILKNNTMWIWDETKKTGMTLTFNPETTGPTGGTTTNASEGDKILADIEKYKNYCKVEVVSDSLFMPPTDVRFTDFSGAMQNIPTVKPTSIPTVPANNYGY